MGFFEEKKKGAFKANLLGFYSYCTSWYKGAFSPVTALRVPYCTHGIYPASYKRRPCSCSCSTLSRIKSLIYANLLRDFHLKLFFSVGKEHHDR